MDEDFQVKRLYLDTDTEAVYMFTDVDKTEIADSFEECFTRDILEGECNLSQPSRSKYYREVIESGDRQWIGKCSSASRLWSLR
jgi:hypothetical protein